MEHKTQNFCRFFTASAALLAPVLARGTGYDLPDQDAFAVARGMAFVATADNPSAIYFNPAGITQLEGNNIRAGAYGLYLDPTYKSPGGQSYEVRDKLHGVPQLFYTYSLKDQDWPLSFGLGLYSPFGLSAKWPQDTGFRSIATEGSLNYYTINPVVAYKLPWHLSVAAGLTVNYASIDLQQGLSNFPNNDLLRFKGDAWAVGYNLGLMWQPIKQLSFGASFRSSTHMNFSGHTDTEINGFLPNTSSSATFNNYPFPLEVAGGISFRPTEKWNLEFDVEYMDWNALGTVPIHQSTVNPALGVDTIPVTFNWQSSCYYELGATRYFAGGWQVSAGYIFNENSVPDAHYNPLVADEDRQFVSVGFGRKGKQFDFDIAYQFGFSLDRTVSGSAPSFTGSTADGTYRFLSHAIAISAGWHF